MDFTSSVPSTGRANTSTILRRMERSKKLPTTLLTTALAKLLLKYPPSLIFPPEVMVSLLPALISTFLPEILMFPLGAERLMPEKASIFTSPSGQEMAI